MSHPHFFTTSEVSNLCQSSTLFIKVVLNYLKNYFYKESNSIGIRIHDIVVKSL